MGRSDDEPDGPPDPRLRPDWAAGVEADEPAAKEAAERRAIARRLRAEEVVLESVAKTGWYWPGD